MTTFYKNVGSFLPSRFAAYARIYHPLDVGRSREPKTWRELGGIHFSDPESAIGFAMRNPWDAHVRFGTLPQGILDVLTPHLRTATVTPEACYFAVWDGFAGSVVPETLRPKLSLPNRDYHVFSGPLSAAQTNFGIGSAHQSANIWWPSDQAWCVATEIDFCWTYIGGTRSCVNAILTDGRLEAQETTASDKW
jgi:hypothetical protein